MQRLIAFFILSTVKLISHAFWPAEFSWLTNKPDHPWKEVKLMVFMNHTSLYEPLFVQALPFSFLWRLSKNIIVPGADITLERPIVGRFWKLMVPNIASITRKRDDSWTSFMASIKPHSVIMIAPEGRMKRPNGLDKFGKPMTVRGGVADILEGLNSGAMVLCLSGGLHQVQSPGQLFPRFFRTIKMNFSYLDIKEYKAHFPGSSRERKINMVKDLQARLEKDCPS